MLFTYMHDFLFTVCPKAKDYIMKLVISPKPVKTIPIVSRISYIVAFNNPIGFGKRCSFVSKIKIEVFLIAHIFYFS